MIIVLVALNKGLRYEIPKQCHTKNFKLFNCIQYCAFPHFDGKLRVRFQHNWNGGVLFI